MKADILQPTVIGLLCMFLLSGCGTYIIPSIRESEGRVTGSGRVVTESRSVNGFSGLVVNGAGVVLIDQTGTESLEITADDNVLPYIVTQVHDGNLTIGLPSNLALHNSTDLTFKLTVKELNSIAVNGAAALDGKGIEASQLALKISGAGAVRLAGKVEQLDMILNGAGVQDLRNLECKRATVTNNGVGAAIVRVSDELNATTNGIGVIEYIGNPQVSRRGFGLGLVSRR